MKRDAQALVRLVDSRQQVPYAWGRDANDCIAFVLAAIEAQTGERVAPDIHWTSRSGALRVIHAFGSIEAALDTYLERIAPAHAHRGDVGGVLDAEFGIHPMIIEGTTLVAPGDRGNRRAKRSAMICAWSIEGLLA